MENISSILEIIFDKLPEEKKEKSSDIIELLNLLKREYRSLFTEEIPPILIVGPPDTGKTTLVKSILGAGKKLLQDRPHANFEDFFKVVDTPGLKSSYDISNCDYIEKMAKNSSLIIVVFSLTYEINEESYNFLQLIKSINENVIVVLNRMDLLEKGEMYYRIRRAEKLLNTEVLPISARYDKNVKKLLSIIVSNNTPLMFSLAKLLPEYREVFSNKCIKKAVFNSIYVTSKSFPSGDFIPLTVLQIAMVLEIGRIYGAKIDMERAKEIVATIGGGILFKMLYRSLSRIFPDSKNFLITSIAASGTFAMGKSAIYYFSNGTKVKKNELRDIYFKEYKRYLTEKKEEK